MKSNNELPFQGLKVLELASVLAGPLAGTFFAEGGASVLKVEHPKSGDVTRSWRMSCESDDSSISAYYSSANTYKEVVRIDLNTTEGQDWLQSQLMQCDILLQNFKQKDLKKFNLSPEKISSEYPNIIHVRLVGFSNSPERLAYDVVVQAETGFMHMNGSPEGPATKMPVAMMDILASHQIRSAALTGLYAREQGKRGWYAEVSLELSGIAALGFQATNYLMNGLIPERRGSTHPNIAPYGEILSLIDGDIVLAIGSDRQFYRLCEILGDLEIFQNQKFATNINRVVNRLELIEILQNLTNNRSREELLEEFHKSGVPAGGIRTLDEVFAKDTNGFETIIEENVVGSKRIVKKPCTTAYKVTVLGNEIL